MGIHYDYVYMHIITLFSGELFFKLYIFDILYLFVFVINERLILYEYAKTWK